MTPACGFENKSSQTESVGRTLVALLAGSALAASSGTVKLNLYLVKEVELLEKSHGANL